ncbi:MAG: ParM/StbA family protein [Chloroflexota bacterium]
MSKQTVKPKSPTVSKQPAEPVIPILLGYDPGSSGVRIVGSSGSAAISAHISSNGASQISSLDGMARRKRPLKIQVGSTTFYVGDTAYAFGRPIENLNHDRQAGTPEMRAVFYATLTQLQKKYGAFNAPVKIAVGLPAQFVTGADAAKNKLAVKSWLIGKHTWRTDDLGYDVEIEEARLTGQAVGAAFDYFLNDDGLWVADRAALLKKKEIGIISIGFDTLELMVMEFEGGKLTPVETMTGGEKLGARWLLERFDPNHDSSFGRLEPKLRDGSLVISPEIMSVWESEVFGFIERKWVRAWKRFGVVNVIGGGAILLRSPLQRYFGSNLVIPNGDEATTLAVARGLYKLLLNQSRSENN